MSFLITILGAAPVFGQTVSDVSIATGAGASASAACITANNCFSPNPINVAPGTTVTWTNTDTVSHTITSGHVSDNNAGSLFDSGLIKSGNTFQFTFVTAGTYDYTCVVHPWMIGQVVVGNGGPPTNPNANATTPIPVTNSSTISIKTDLPSYNQGDNVVLTGHITNPQGSTAVTYRIFNPSQNLVSVRQLLPDPNGSFSSTFLATGPLWTNAGTYTIQVMYGQVSPVTTTFYFSGGSGTSIIPPITSPGDVTSLFIDKQAYSSGNTIYFSGTTANNASPNVTLLLFDPNNKFLMIASGIVNVNHQFQISVDTSLPNNQRLFSLQGTYTATAFVSTQANGKSVSFAYSPNVSNIPITVSLDKSSYTLGDMITVSGTVSSIIVGNLLTVQILDPSNNLVEVSQVDVSQDGKYTDTFRAQGALWKLNGIYTVKTIYGSLNNISQTTFLLSYSPQSQSNIVISADAGASASSACVTANNCFSPNPINVSPGTTVTWTNNDKLSHTVTSGHVSDDNAGSLFDSGLIKQGNTFQFTFAIAGTYDYFCTVHPWMVGQVVVGNGVQPSPSIITAATDKASYNIGDSIVVSGTVSPVNSVNPQQPVTIQTYDLYDVLVRIDQAIPSPSGQFSTTIPIHGPGWQTSGTYTLKIQYDQPSSASKLTFYFNSGTITPPQSQSDIFISAGSGASASADCVAAKKCFDPGVLNVAPGTTVTWTNNDKLSHTITSGKVSDDNAGSLFDSGLVKAGKTFQFTFAIAGTYDYFCTVHPWMVGQVVVGNGGPLPTPQPVPTPTDLKVSTDKLLYYGGDTVTATIVLSGANSGQNIAISFNDPTGNTIISRTVTTDNNGMATSQFKVPITAKVGNYQVVVTSSVNSKEFNASSQFTIQQKIDQVSIISVQATDQQGNQVSSFTRGSTGYVKVVLSAQTSIPSLATVNLFDSDYTTLGIGSFKTNLAIGQSTVILSFPIPNDAIVGTGNIYTDVFTDWPSNGGKPLTGESAAIVEIK